MGEQKSRDSTTSSSEAGDEQVISNATSIVSQGVDGPEQEKLEKEKEESEQVTTRHLKSLQEFTEDLDNAAKQALQKRHDYNRIVALVLYWEDADGLKHLRRKADKLSSKLKDIFKYETKTMPIPSDDDAREDFKWNIGQEVRKVGKDPKSLLIMYYGGHADNKDNKLVWMKENSPTSKSIRWSVWQSFLLEDTACDKLFLMDCCHAGDIIERMAWKGACELLGASSGALQASAKSDSSFTKALLKILGESTTWDIRDIYASFTDSVKRKATYELTVDPFFWDYSNGLHPPLCLRPAESKQNLSPTQADIKKTKTISDARILIKVIFHGEASIVMEEWQRFLSRLPKAITGFAFNACREASLIGLWQSNSCIAIWALPVWLWAGILPTAKGFEFLGIIRSRNVAAIEFNADSMTHQEKLSAAPLEGTVSEKGGKQYLDYRKHYFAEDRSHTPTLSDKAVAEALPGTPSALPTAKRPNDHVKVEVGGQHFGTVVSPHVSPAQSLAHSRDPSDVLVRVRHPTVAEKTLTVQLKKPDVSGSISSHGPGLNKITVPLSDKDENSEPKLSTGNLPGSLLLRQRSLNAQAIESGSSHGQKTAIHEDPDKISSLPPQKNLDLRNNQESSSRIHRDSQKQRTTQDPSTLDPSKRAAGGTDLDGSGSIDLSTHLSARGRTSRAHAAPHIKEPDHKKTRKDVRVERDLQKGLSQERLQRRLGINFNNQPDWDTLANDLKEKRKFKPWGRGERSEVKAM